MPASGNKDEMSQKELQQREEAALKHGVYSRKMTPEKKVALAGLQDQLSTRPGVVNLMIEQTAKAIQVANVAAAYVAAKHNGGTPLDRVPLAKSLPAFFNTANRAINQLFGMLPDEANTLNEGEILNQIRRGQVNDGGEN